MKQHKHEPLDSHLEKLPAGKSTVTPRFAQIERLVGTKLPKFAFALPKWWANQGLPAG